MIDQYPPANGVLTSLIWRKTAVGGETSLSGYDNASQALSYTPGQEQVYLNGILLVRGSDYTATNGTSITSLTALAVDDFVQINCYNNFSVASVPAASITGEVTNSQITSLATTKLTGTITNAQLAGSIANDKLTNSSITINGSAVALGGSVSLAGDIESVTAGTGISGGGSSGAVTITNSMATAIDAKGDLIIGTGADTFSKLGVGANGTVLTASSGEATGLSWATPSSGGMTLLSTTTLSGSSTSISSIDQTYNTLQVWIYGVYRSASTDSVELFIAPNGDTSECSNGAGTYQDEGTPYTTAFGGYNQKLAVNCGATMRLEQTSGGGNGNYGWVLTISNYTSSTQIKAVNCFGRFKRSGGSKGSVNWGGGIFLTDAITSLVFSLSSGDFGGGTVRIYGVK